MPWRLLGFSLMEGLCAPDLFDEVEDTLDAIARSSTTPNEEKTISKGM